MKYSLLSSIIALILIPLFGFTQYSPAGVKPSIARGIIPGSAADYCSKGHISSGKILNINNTAGMGDYDLKHLEMEFEIDPSILFIRGSVSSFFKVNHDVNTIEMELVVDYTIDSIIYNNNPLTFEHTALWDLIIHFPNIIQTGSLQQVKIYYHGVPSTAQGFGSVGFGTHNGTPAMWTLSEPYGARDWWPGKNDLTDKIDSIDVIVHCPQQYRAASNGLLISDVVNGGIRTNHWKHKYPIACYLIAVAVTDYAVYTDTTYSKGEIVPILNYVYPEDLEITKQDTKNLIPVMPLYSDLFIKYPFIDEKYGHAQFGWGGGMEHQTMTFLGVFQYEIMAHELAHQWFGDMVTTNSWHDIWLNEGFATYLTGLSYEHLFEGVYWPVWKQWNLESVVSQPGGSVYVDDTTNINRIFSSRLSYSKGALVLHSLRWVVGDSAFFQACINYLNDSVAKYGFASTDLLKMHMEESSGMDLTEFFADWYYGEGYPSYTASITTSDNISYSVSISQATSHPSVDFFEMPVPIQFIGADKDTIIVFDNTSINQQYTIEPGFAIQQVKIDPDQWLISDNNQIILDTADPHSLSTIKVYPNPANHQIRIILGNRRGEVIISDLTGRVVRRFNEVKDSDLIDISELKAGTYYIHVAGNSPADVSFVKF